MLLPAWNYISNVDTTIRSRDAAECCIGIDVGRVQRTAADPLTAAALTVGFTSRCAHHTFQSIMETDAADIFGLDSLATEAFLLQTTDLAVALAAEACRKVEVGTAERAATNFNSIQ